MLRLVRAEIFGRGVKPLLQRSALARIALTRTVRAMFVRALLFFALLAPAVRVGHAADVPTAAVPFDRVTIEPTKTSIYIGTVSMIVPTFARADGAQRYESTYAAKVFPFSFFNEAGTLAIDVSDEQLRTLARGEAIDFTGRGVRSDGAERRVEGHATPTDATNGKLKVRVRVSKRVELIFNTTYRFEAASATGQ
jgi:hypothetical protein